MLPSDAAFELKRAFRDAVGSSLSPMGMFSYYRWGGGGVEVLGFRSGL